MDLSLSSIVDFFYYFQVLTVAKNAVISLLVNKSWCISTVISLGEILRSRNCKSTSIIIKGHYWY